MLEAHGINIVIPNEKEKAADKAWREKHGQTVDEDDDDDDDDVDVAAEGDGGQGNQDKDKAKSADLVSAGEGRSVGPESPLSPASPAFGSPGQLKGPSSFFHSAFPQESSQGDDDGRPPFPMPTRHQLALQLRDQPITNRAQGKKPPRPKAPPPPEVMDWADEAVQPVPRRKSSPQREYALSTLYGHRGRGPKPPPPDSRAPDR
eukprot:gene17033-2512_t